MPLRRFQPVLAAALLLVVGSPVWGQAWAGRGRLQGNVTDEQNRPVEGATVTLRIGTDRVDAAQPGPDLIKTNKAGKWQVLGLAQGSWGVLIEKEGFLASEGQVKVNEFGPAQPINVTLKLIPKEVAKQAPQSQVQTVVNEADAFLQQQKYAEARAKYETAITELPADDAANRLILLRRIASTWILEGNDNQAITALKQTLQLKADDIDTIKLLVDRLYATGQQQEAETYRAQLPADFKVDPNTLMNIGIEHYNAKRYDQAAEQFGRVISENANMPDAYYYRGRAYLALAKTAEAKADFQKLLELDPQHPRAEEVKEFLKAL